MAITRELFEFVRDEYGRFASWAVWPEENGSPKSNMDDLSLFDQENINRIIDVLHVDFVLVGLNISIDLSNVPLSNFHGKNGEVYKARYALRDTPLWGSYMTDIIKNFPEPRSDKILKILNENNELEVQHIAEFKKEISSISKQPPVLIAFGSGVFHILNRHFSDNFRIIKIPHYAARLNKETYRQKIRNTLVEAIGWNA